MSLWDRFNLDPPNDPLSARLPQYQTALARQNRDADLNALINRYVPEIGLSARALQNERVNTIGTTPYSKPILAKAIRAAGEHRAITPEPGGNILQNAVKDVQGLTSLLNPFNFIKAVAGEIAALPTLPSKLVENTAKATNPLEMLGGFAKSPGLRLIPGSYIAGTLAPGEEGLVSGLSSHPVYSLLDVLPYIGKAAKATKVVQAAEDVNKLQKAAALEHNIPLPTTRVRPVRTLLEYYQRGEPGGVKYGEPRVISSLPALPGAFDENGLATIPGTNKVVSRDAIVTAPALEPNAWGRRVEAFGEKAREIPLIREAFDTKLKARNIARTVASSTSEMTQRKGESIVRDQLEQLGLDVKKHLDSSDVAEVAAALSPDDQKLLLEKLQFPEEVKLPEHLQSHYDYIRDTRDKMTEAQVQMGRNGVVTQYGREESYPIALANRINASRDTLRRRVESYGERFEKLRQANGTRLTDAFEAKNDALRMMGQLGDDLFGGQNRKAEALQRDISRLHDERTQASASHDALKTQVDSVRKVIDTGDWDEFRNQVFNLAQLEQDSYLGGGQRQLFPYNDLFDAATRVGEMERKAIPARWQPLLEREMNKRILDSLNDPDKLPEAVKYAKDEDVSHVIIGRDFTREQAIKMLAEHNYSWMDSEQKAAFVRDVSDTLAELQKNAKEIPVSMPPVTPQEAMRALQSPSIFSYVPKRVLRGEREFANSPGMAQAPYLSLYHDAHQEVLRAVSDRAAETVARTYGIRAGALQDQLMRQSGHILEDTSGVVEPTRKLWDAAAHDWVPFDPETWQAPPPSRGGWNNVDPDTIMLPRDVYNAIQDFRKGFQTDYTKLTSKTMNVFRHSVLTLRPQFYVNNITGGLITQSTHGNPAALVTHFRDAMAMARNPDVMRTLKDGTAMTLSDVKGAVPAQEALKNVAQYGIEESPSAVSNFLAQYQQFEAGKAYRKMWDKIKDNSAHFNAVNDQFYQTVMLLEGRGKALKKGATEAEAIQAGVEHARAAFETWDTLTPMERTIMKSIFPFYGFTRNVLRYAMQYPEMHPVRASILSHIAHAEQEDFGSGLPQRFNDLFWLGPTSEDGKVKTFSIGGMNPFQDVANYPALLGFMSGQGGDIAAITRNVNPLLSFTLKSMGIDPSSGQQDLYPDAYFDPASGQMSVRSGNFITNAVNAIVPQTAAVTDPFMTDFKSLLRSNPEAAGRSLLAALGAPTYVMPRDLDVPRERMKSEITRTQQSRKVLNEALRTGDWSEAERWPSLQKELAAIKALPEAQRKNYLLRSEHSLIDAVLGRTG